MITETRVAKALLQKKIFDSVSNIVGQERYPQKIKGCILNGVVAAAKSFKGRMFVLKHLIPLISENVRTYGSQIDKTLLQPIVRLLTVVGGQMDRSIFIPGQSRENELVRQLFIRSNSLKLLLFLQKKYPKVCEEQTAKLMNNLSEKDWQLFYQCSGNKKKRCYSPKVNTAPDQEEQTIVINATVLQEERSRKMSMKQTT